MCLSGTTYLPTDCYFGELALQNPTERVCLLQSEPHHHLIDNNFGELALQNPTERVCLLQSEPHHHLIDNKLVFAMI